MDIPVEWKFELGELVYLKTATHDTNCTPRKFWIASRILANEEPGSYSKFYRLFPFPTGMPAVGFPEEMLQREMPPYENMWQQRVGSLTPDQSKED